MSATTEGPNELEIIEKSRGGERDENETTSSGWCTPDQKKGTRLGRFKRRRNIADPSNLKYRGLARGPLRKLGRGVNASRNRDFGYGRTEVHMALEDHPSGFYEYYLRTAEKFDKDFVKTCNEDLNLVLLPASLISVMASTFIISINSDAGRDNYLNPILSILLIISGDPDAVPDPPEVDWVTFATLACLCFSLAISFLTVFSAILVKQWVNRYAAVDMEGTAAKRCQVRQRRYEKFIRAPRLSNVIVALLGMAQLAFLCLGIATAIYLFGINISLALPLAAVPLLVVVLYALLTLKGAADAGYPYQTPMSHGLRTFKTYLKRASGQTHIEPHSPNQELDELDIRSVSWTLRRSVDMGARISALEHLATMGTLASLGPDLVADCFDVFVDCVNVNDNNVVVVPGLGRLAAASAMSFLRTLSHLSATDQESWVFGYVRRRYFRILPPEAAFRHLPFYHTLGAIHRLFNSNRKHEERPEIEWRDYEPSGHEHSRVSRALAELALSEYRRNERRKREKVPRWIIRFVLHSLSLDPPTAVVVDCLSIVAIDLGCEAPSTGVTASRESEQQKEVATKITQKLSSAIEASNLQFTHSRRKAIVALFPYAVWQQQEGNREMFDTFLRLASIADLRRHIWRHILPFVSTLLHEESEDSLKLAAVLTSPLFPWRRFSHPDQLIKLWAAAASALPYTEEIGRSVINALLYVASQEDLREHMPTEMWSWLNKRPPLPPVCPGRRWGSSLGVVRTVRGRKDTEILTSYLRIIWSEWNHIDSEGLKEMHTAIQKDLEGAQAGHYREDLLQHLDEVLKQLGLELEQLRRDNPNITEAQVQLRKGQYGKLKKALQMADGSAVDDPIHGPPSGPSSSVHPVHSLE